MSRRHLLVNARQCEWFFFLFAVFRFALLPEIDKFHRNCMRSNVIPSNSCQYILERGFVILVDQPVLGIFCKYVDTTHARHLEFAIQALPPDLNIDIALMYFEITANFTLRSRSTGEIQPVTSWMGRTTGDDIDYLPALQLIIQGNHARHKPLIVTATALGDNTRPSAPV